MDIYIAKDGQPIGPYRPNEIQARLEDSTFDGTELACHEGLDEWVGVLALLISVKSEPRTVAEEVVDPIDVVYNDGSINADWTNLTWTLGELIESMENPSDSVPMEYQTSEAIFLDSNENYYFCRSSIGEETEIESADDEDLVDYGVEDHRVPVKFYSREWADLLTENGTVKSEYQQLTKLYLSSSQISDITPLKDLTQLEELHLSNNQLTDVKGLENLTKLKQLFLYSNQLTNVNGLEKLTQLTRLDLGYNKLTSVKGLEKLTQLKTLSLYDNSDLTKAQIDELQKALPKCDILSNPTK